jgi:FtsP/CotA-like multicopper oxidase with cupredoxin domain
VNGKNWAECNQTLLDGFGYGTQCDTLCTYSNIEIEPEKTYLFRFIAATIDTFAGIAIQDHNLTIVQADGGSWLEPYNTNYLEVHSGQRYAAIVKGKSLQELQETQKITYVSLETLT